MTVDPIFSGLKVVDLASYIAGPAAATVLSDFGADVIKVEPTELGDAQRFTHVHPSGLPLTRRPRMDQGPLRLSPELRTPPLPATHVRGGDRATNTYPGYVIDDTADLHSQRATHTCDLVSHGTGSAFPNSDG